MNHIEFCALSGAVAAWVKMAADNPAVVDKAKKKGLSGRHKALLAALLGGGALGGGALAAHHYGMLPSLLGGGAGGGEGDVGGGEMPAEQLPMPHAAEQLPMPHAAPQDLSGALPERSGGGPPVMPGGGGAMKSNFPDSPFKPNAGGRGTFPAPRAFPGD